MNESVGSLEKRQQIRGKGDTENNKKSCFVEEGHKEQGTSTYSKNYRTHSRARRNHSWIQDTTEMVLGFKDPYRRFTASKCAQRPRVTKQWKMNVGEGEEEV